MYWSRKEIIRSICKFLFYNKLIWYLRTRDGTDTVLYPAEYQIAQLYGRRQIVKDVENHTQKEHIITI